MSIFYDLIKRLCNSPGVQNDPPASFTDTDEENDHYKQYLNDALKQIFSEDWNFRETSTNIQIVQGVSAYLRPAGIISKNGISIDGVPLKCIDVSCLPIRNGKPIAYGIKGNNLILFPTPDKTYTLNIDYKNMFSVIAADGTQKNVLTAADDMPNIPDDFQDLIVAKAELLYIRDKGSKNQGLAISNVQSRINQLIDYDRGSYENTPCIVWG